MTKPTPGPWDYGKLGNDADQYGVYAEWPNAEGRTIAVTYDDEGGANARIIAAAWGLLEAAQVFIAGGENGDAGEEARGYTLLREAIAEATGEDASA